ncbi:hypothetical protein C8R42DRAFT_777806 [Lentinula raphanica]|nr:hypothetical protein C8R42DRAFT_777806 [Lentinula raphanica]
MSMYPSLPSELFELVIAYIAHTPRLPHSRSRSPFKCASPELLALSVANWQLRRVCLPFLFANIKIRDEMEVHQMENYLALFSQFTQVLVIKPLFHTEDQTMAQILPQLEQLSEVELRRCRRRSDLLRSIISHPTVTSILLDELPDQSMCNDDLSKVFLDRKKFGTLSPELERFLDHGMRIVCLELHKPDSEFIVQFESKIFPGLEEIRILMGTIPISFSWLPVLSSTQPTLKKFWLIGGHREWFFNVEFAPPFLSALIQKSQRRKLQHHFFIEEVGLGRAIGPSSQEWHAIGLTLTTTFASTFLIEVLTLIASVFPQLEILTLKLDAHEGMYDIGDLCSVIARFSSLRVVYFHRVFDRLIFGPEIVKLVPSVQNLETSDAVDQSRTLAENGLWLFTSRLAKQVKTLDSIHISDMGHEYDDFDNRTGTWYLTGWLHVLNGNRDIGGRLANTLELLHRGISNTMLPY